MLVIRQEQFDALSKSLEDRFVRRAVQHLHERLAAKLHDRKLRGDAVEQLVREGIALARPYGVVAEADVLRYLECMVLLGPRFDSDAQIPWAGQILHRADLSGEGKMDEIDEYLIFEKPY